MQRISAPRAAPAPTTPEPTLDSFLNADWFGIPHATIMGTPVRPQHFALALLLVLLLGLANGSIVALVLFMFYRTPPGGLGAPAATQPPAGADPPPTERRSSTRTRAPPARGYHSIHDFK